ncbi:unnamed protein product [Symbiodinium sp. CCMP2592]|nr:unnamed protein product [Symbiodinium sp. CCMP2592]
MASMASSTASSFDSPDTNVGTRCCNGPCWIAFSDADASYLASGPYHGCSCESLQGSAYSAQSCWDPAAYSGYAYARCAIHVHYGHYKSSRLAHYGHDSAGTVPPMVVPLALLRGGGRARCPCEHHLSWQTVPVSASVFFVSLLAFLPDDVFHAEKQKTYTVSVENLRPCDTTPDPTLQSPRERHEDPEGRGSFYYNPGTKEVTWRRPRPAPVLSRDEEDDSARVLPGRAQKVIRPPRTPSPPPGRTPHAVEVDDRGRMKPTPKHRGPRSERATSSRPPASEPAEQSKPPAQLSSQNDSEDPYEAAWQIQSGNLLLKSAGAVAASHRLDGTTTTTRKPRSEEQHKGRLFSQRDTATADAKPAKAARTPEVTQVSCDALSRRSYGPGTYRELVWLFAWRFNFNKIRSPVPGKGPPFKATVEPKTIDLDAMATRELAYHAASSPPTRRPVAKRSRCGLLPILSSLMLGVARGAPSVVPPGALQLPDSLPTPTHHAVYGAARKRSYKRAVRRAAQSGDQHTFYRGRVCSLQQLCHGYRGGKTAPAASKKAQQYYLQRAQRRLLTLSWNAGGLTQALWQELLLTLENMPVPDRPQIVCVQETHWSSVVAPAFKTADWEIFTSPTTDNKSAGLLVLVDKSLARGCQIVYADPQPGRLQHLRLIHPQWTADILHIYQKAYNSHPKAVKEAREIRSDVWNSIRAQLQRLPARNTLIMLGDCNTPLKPSGAAGVRIATGQSSSPGPSDQARLQALIEDFSLCHLNSWCRSAGPTYHHAKGTSLIDHVFMRHLQADDRAKQARPINLGLAAWRLGGYHLPVKASLPLTRFHTLNKPSPTPREWDHWSLVQASSDLSDPRIAQLRTLLLQALPAVTNLEQMHAALKQCAKRVFPPTTGQHRLAIWQTPTMRNGIKAMWQAYRTWKQAKQQNPADVLRISRYFHLYKTAHKDFKKAGKAAKKVQLRDPQGQLQDPSTQLAQLTKHYRALYATDADPNIAGPPRAAINIEVSEADMTKALASHSRPRISDTVHMDQAMDSDSGDVANGMAGFNPEDSTTIIPQEPEAHRAHGIKRHAPQFAYMPGRSAAQAIQRVVLHCSQVQRKCSYSTPTVVDRHAQLPKQLAHFAGIQLSLDLTGAFDLLDWRLLARALTSAGVPVELKNQILSWYAEITYVITHLGLTAKVQAQQGLRQGCKLAPLLWILSLAQIYRDLQAREDPLLNHDWMCENSTIYADDIHLKDTVSSVLGLDRMVHRFCSILDALRANGMVINLAKSAILLRHRGSFIKAWLRRHLIQKKDGNVLRLRRMSCTEASPDFNLRTFKSFRLLRSHEATHHAKKTPVPANGPFNRSYDVVQLTNNLLSLRPRRCPLANLRITCSITAISVFNGMTGQREDPMDLDAQEKLFWSQAGPVKRETEENRPDQTFNKRQRLGNQNKGKGKSDGKGKSKGKGKGGTPLPKAQNTAASWAYTGGSGLELDSPWSTTKDLADPTGSEMEWMEQRVSKLTQLVLRQEQMITALKQDMVLHLFIRSGPEGMIPVLCDTADKWRTMKEESPEKITYSLKLVMLKQLLITFHQRLTETAKDAEAMARAQKLGWIDDQQQWKHLKWNATTQALEVDATLRPIPTSDLLAQLVNVRKAVNEESLLRFKSVRRLTPEVTSEWIQFQIILSMRQEGGALWSTLTQWIGQAAWHTLGCRLRKDRPVYDNLVQEARLHSGTFPMPVLQLLPWSVLLQAWRNVHHQHDAAELATYLLPRLGDMGMHGCWEARNYALHGVTTLDSGPLGQPLAIVPNEGDVIHLQQSVEGWCAQVTAKFALKRAAQIVCLQLMRYRNLGGTIARDGRALVGFRDGICLPVFVEDHSMQVQWIRYQVTAAQLHFGDVPTTGHYRTLLYGQNAFAARRLWITDDNHVAQPVEPSQYADVMYLLWLRKETRDDTRATSQM